MRLICLGNRKQTGKSTTADYLSHKYGFKSIAFADKLKLEVAWVYKLDLHQLNDPTLKETILPELGKTPRQLMQEHGTAKRNEDKNYWLRLLQETIYDYDSFYEPGYVISDVRLLNEAEWIRNCTNHRQNILVNIVNPRVPRIDKHISEIELDNYPHWTDTIVNDSTIPVLYDRIEQQII